MKWNLLSTLLKNKYQPLLKKKSKGLSFWKKPTSILAVICKYLLALGLSFGVGVAVGSGFLGQLMEEARVDSSQDFSIDVSTHPSPSAPSTEERWLPIGQLVLKRPGFIVGYDGRNRGPAWVYERLTAANLRGKEARGSFYEDGEIPKSIRASLRDYQRTGYDRGHMAPAADHKASAHEMHATFALSNMIPQNPTCNRGPWKRLEEHVRELTKCYVAVHVISGTAYVPQDGEKGRYVFYPVIGSSDAGVPTHLWKVIRGERQDGSVTEEAYLLPNDDSCKDKDWRDFKTTTEKIEHLAGVLLCR